MTEPVNENRVRELRRSVRTLAAENPPTEGGARRLGAARRALEAAHAMLDDELQAGYHAMRRAGLRPG
jgi:hypothetical protein